MVFSDNDFPADKLPQCWSDDTRMNALFAPFRLKSVNPESWNMKMKFWSDMLRQWCKHRSNPVLTVNDARVAFQRNGRRPACLDIVVEECVRKGDLVLVSKYTSVVQSGPEGWVRWGAKQAFRPAAFAVGLLASYLPLGPASQSDSLPKSTIDPSQPYVLESALKDQSNELLRSFPADVERLGTLEELLQAAGMKPSELETFQVMLGYLVAHGLAAKKCELFKIAESSGKSAAITEADESLHRLLCAERQLLADVAKFEEEARLALVNTQAALRLGNKAAAKNHLRRKHRYTEHVASSEMALENVRLMLHDIRQLEVNAAVVDTYRTGAEAMKRVMREGKLDEESAHRTMDELRDVMEAYGEVEKALSCTMDDCDAAELEDELEVLMATGPGNPSKGTPERLPTGPKKAFERDFVFDGEERMMAELNDLSVEDRAGTRAKASKKKAVAVVEWEEPAAATAPKPIKPSPPKPERDGKASKKWYPPTSEALVALDSTDGPAQVWKLSKIDNLDKCGPNYSLDSVYNSTGELRTDPRLHPGQRLEHEYGNSGPVMYDTDSHARDHKLDDGVWLYNKEHKMVPRTERERTFSNSTDYPVAVPITSAVVPDNSDSFLMAPGGERKSKNQPWSDPETKSSTDDIEKRLKNLRSLNL